MLHSVPYTNPSGDFIAEDLAPLPGEEIISPNGPDKFLRRFKSEVQQCSIDSMAE